MTDCVATADLWLDIQHSDFALLVDLLDGLNFGTEHISLEAAVLQQLVSGDAFGHGVVGDEVIFLPVLLILALRPGGVCAEDLKS